MAIAIELLEQELDALREQSLLPPQARLRTLTPQRFRLELSVLEGEDLESKLDRLLINSAAINIANGNDVLNSIYDRLDLALDEAEELF